MMMDLTFVLTGTTHTGNIGAAARAMKNMGFGRLHLVGACSHRSDEAIARASGAHDVLENALVFATLADAVAHAHVVVGTTARDRHLAVPVEACRDVAEGLRELTLQQPSDAGRLQAAILFGRERSGLSNEELDMCTRLLRIPCNPAFSSLNLGSAVQVVAYELSLAVGVSAPAATTLPAPYPEPGSASASIEDRLAPLAEVSAGMPPPAGKVTADGFGRSAAARGRSTRAEENTPATSEAMQYFFAHLQQVMVDTGFLDPDRPRQLMRRLRRYFERNRPSVNELNILRGILAAAEASRSSSRDPEA